MKITCTLLIAILILLTSCAQNSKEIEGAWLWKDSTNTNMISLIIKNDNLVSRYAGPNTTMHPEDFKNGKYSLSKDSLFFINGDSKTLESCRIKFIRENVIQLTYESTKGPFSNREYIFHRVFDEEVNKADIPPEVKKG